MKKKIIIFPLLLLLSMNAMFVKCMHALGDSTPSAPYDIKDQVVDASPPNLQNPQGTQSNVDVPPSYDADYYVLDESGQDAFSQGPHSVVNEPKGSHMSSCHVDDRSVTTFKLIDCSDSCNGTCSDAGCSIVLNKVGTYVSMRGLKLALGALTCGLLCSDEDDEVRRGQGHIKYI